MTTVSLSAVEIATLVNGSDDLKAAVLTEYLKGNAPTLEITGLETSAADSLSLGSSEVSVAVGATNTVDVTSAGDSDISVSSSDEKIATVSYADGKLTIAGVAAGSATVTVTKGDASATLAVTVTA